MAAPCVNVHGFTVLRTKVSETSPEEACHYVYLTEHKVRGLDESKPVGRTIFVLSLPPYCDQACVERLFGDCGPIERVSIQNKPLSKPTPPAESTLPHSVYFDPPERAKGYQFAYVVFKNKASVKKALQMSYTDLMVLFPPDTPAVTGLTKWCREYANALPPNPDSLEKDIDTYMARYERLQAKRVEAALEKSQVPDEDGWVTVSRLGKKKKAAPRTEGHEARTKLRDKKRTKEKELLHFYAYQIRESKKDYVAQLREKFEEDKRRIEQMKSARKFRPY